ncbi:hypothetical protein Tco_0352834 [Tanacetum coccineum]
MSWISRCSWCGGPFNSGNCLCCTNVCFGDEFVCNPDPIANNETQDFSYPPSQPQTSSFDQFHCFHCGDPLEDGVRFQRCTCVRCGYYLGEGFCSFCNSEAGNSFVYDSNPNSFNDPPNVFTHPPQPQYESYSCELCGNDSHYGYDCPPRFPLVYEQEPSYNQNFSDNYYPQNSPSFPQQYLCCENCAHGVEDRLMVEIIGVVPIEGFCLFCASRDDNSSIDAPNPNSFNDPLNELCYNQNFGDNYYPQNSPSFPQQYLNCEKCGGPHDDYQCQSWHQNYSELNPFYDSNSYGFDQPSQYSIDHQPQEDLNQQSMDDVYNKWDNMIESRNELLQSLGEMLRQREQATNLSTYTTEPSRRFNYFYDDDDYEESIIPLNEIVSQIPSSIANTPILLTLEPEDSLITGDEDLSTMPEKESDEVIKSSVENLVLIPSESEDIPRSDSECDLPSCDDFSPINITEGKSMTFSNPLFDSNDDFTSSDDESLFDKDVSEDTFKIYSNPLFEFDDEYISSNVNPLFDELFKNIESKESYVSNLNEPALLVTPLSALNEDECFDPGVDVDEIELLLHRDPSTPKISVATIL